MTAAQKAGEFVEMHAKRLRTEINRIVGKLSPDTRVSNPFLEEPLNLHTRSLQAIQSLQSALAESEARVRELEGALEEISNAWSDAVQSDMENGVKCLNEAAAEKFKLHYPEICATGEVITKHNPILSGLHLGLYFG